MDEMAGMEGVSPGEGATAYRIVGDAPRWSECCLADVQNRTEQVHAIEDWHRSYFVCAKCGSECKIITHPFVAGLEAENRELRAQLHAG